MTDKTISQKIQASLSSSHFELLNESHMHAGPATDSHYKLVIVSEAFRELPKVKRHQTIYKILAEELAGPVHALALHLYTPEEWEENAKLAPDSPECSNNK